jgi:hypothetical protein
MIINASTGVIDPMVYTGRGTWIPISRTTLPKLLQSFDRAYPEYTDGTRADLISRWNAADQAKGRVAA